MVAIKYVLENMYCRYIIGAKKIKKKKKNYLCQRFQKCWYRPFKFYSFKTYINTFESVGIGTAYASAFKNTGIGRMLFPALFRSGDPIPTFTTWRFEAPRKKMLG